MNITMLKFVITSLIMETCLKSFTTLLSAGSSSNNVIMRIRGETHCFYEGITQLQNLEGRHSNFVSWQIQELGLKVFLLSWRGDRNPNHLTSHTVNPFSVREHYRAYTCDGKTSVEKGGVGLPPSVRGKTQMVIKCYLWSQWSIGQSRTEQDNNLEVLWNRVCWSSPVQKLLVQARKSWQTW